MTYTLPISKNKNILGFRPVPNPAYDILPSTASIYAETGAENQMTSSQAKPPHLKPLHHSIACSNSLCLASDEITGRQWFEPK